MYHRHLETLIVSRSHELEQLLESIPAEDNFTHRFCTSEHLTQERLEAASIVVVDFAAINRDEAFKVLALSNNDTIVIGCFSSNDFSMLSDVQHCLTQVWAKPFDDEKIRKSFSRILKEIKQREDARLNQVYLDTLIDSLPELIWFKDARGSHLKVNDSFSKTVNKTKAQIEGRGHYYIWDLEPDEYAQGEYICLESEEIVLDKKETCLFDETVKCGGEMRKFKTYKSPIFDADGSVIGTVGFAHDVTDLQNLMIELNIMIEGLPFAVMVTDKDKRITNVNQKFIDIFQLERNEFAGLWAESLLDETRKFDRSKKWAFDEENGSIFMHSHNRVLELHDEKLLDIFGVFTGYLST
ncbi:PAS domain-containing protein [uncultured Cohaesibacter sp.]|uniref:PAS domain-containing protein n=1 Tax=uncultured Cohaesibacter sp. TaxID=1002546 RepID=UPI0029C6E4DB|nr:PAS domain-containing protein [uncultured Cohaesibacter sp.]